MLLESHCWINHNAQTTNCLWWQDDAVCDLYWTCVAVESSWRSQPEKFRLRDIQTKPVAWHPDLDFLNTPRQSQAQHIHIPRQTMLVNLQIVGITVYFETMMVDEWEDSRWVQCEENRSKDRSLWHAAIDLWQLREDTIVAISALPVRDIRWNPRQCNRVDAKQHGSGRSCFEDTRVPGTELLFFVARRRRWTKASLVYFASASFDKARVYPAGQWACPDRSKPCRPMTQRSIHHMICMNRLKSDRDGTLFHRVSSNLWQSQYCFRLRLRQSRDNQRVIGDDLRTHSGAIANRHQLIGLGDEDVQRMSRAVSRSSDVLW